MVVQETDLYIKACMKTWMFCEACVYSEKETSHPKKALIDRCNTCSHSCFSVVSRIINDSDLLQDSALACLCDCRECYEECAKYGDDEDIQYCGEVCLFCADKLKELILPLNLN
jgi:hypothetical protein